MAHRRDRFGAGGARWTERHLAGAGVTRRLLTISPCIAEVQDFGLTAVGAMGEGRASYL